MSSKNDQEEDYFARLEREKTERLKDKLDSEAANKAAAERKALHAGHCGRCGGPFKVHLFKGVDIDICEDCGAVLLDPGELEELAGKDNSGVLSTIGELFNFSRKGSKS